MGHPVSIDDEEIASTLNRYAAEAPPIVSDSDEPSAPVSNPEAWRKPAKLVASILAHKVCPNWSVTPEVQEQWAEALAECADQLMPGGLGNVDAWGPWGKLLFASATWAMCGFDVERFAFKPLHAAPEKPAPPPGPAGADTREDRGAPHLSVVTSGGYRTDA